MKLSTSEPLYDGNMTFRQWDVTPEVIVVTLDHFDPETYKLESLILQARNWEGKQLWQINVAQTEPWGLAVGGNFVFLGSETGAIHEFDLASGAATHVYHEHDSPVDQICTTRDSTGALLMISSSHDGSIQVWDQASKTRRFHLTGVHIESIFCMEIKDTILISTGTPTVAIWDVSTGVLLQTYTCGDTRLYATALIGDEMLATGGGKGKVWLFDRKTGKLIDKLSTGSRVLNGLMLYRPDILISTDTSGQVCAFSLETKKLINKVKVHDHSTLTRTILNNTVITGGKEGGGEENACGLDCSLKACDLETLLKGGETKPVELGFPCVAVWQAQAVGDRLAVSLFKRGKPYLEFWDLD